MATNLKNVKQESLAIINAALTIINNFPEFDETNTGLSLNLSSSDPFTYLMDLFKSTTGYNVLIRIISSFIATALPGLELAVKGVILSNLKNILSCSINPFFTRELLQNGLVFDLRSLDLMRILNYCPLDREGIGHYSYFGCDSFDITDDLKKAGDFNAFLWYVKNRSLRRQVWYGVNIVKSNTDFSSYDTSIPVLQKTPKSMPPSKGQLNSKGKLVGNKCKKNDGIITLQYCERPDSMRNAEGNGNTLETQTPYNNCLQVFIGNTQECDTHLAELENQYRTANNSINDITAEINTVQSDIDSKNYEIKEVWQSSIGLNTWQSSVNMAKALLKQQELTPEIQQLTQKKEELENEKEQFYSAKTQAETEINYILSNGPEYRLVEQNYYYKRTLMEFDTDYVMSLKLFDSKTLTVQLIDAMTGCLSVDLHLSAEQLLVKYETERMVKQIVETDETVINDCFFTFGNEEYDKMLQKAQQIHEGIYSTSNQDSTGVNIDATSLMNELNGINGNQENNQTIIEGTLTELSKTLSDTNYQQGKVNFSAQVNFIENLMNNLAFVITASVISPRLYLLLGINLKLLGESTTLSINDFMEKYKQLLVNIIREIRDQLIQYLVNELMKVLSDLAKQVAVKLTVEQMKYYRRLLKKLMDCFRRNRSTIDFNIDNVDYADIYTQEEESVNNEC